MNVLMLSSEIFPFAKTSGVADVVGSLPVALKARGIDVRLAMPRYSVIPAAPFRLREAVPAFEVPLDGTRDRASIVQTTIGGDVPVYFVDNPRLYQRDGIYMFPDDAERFIFFCRAALEMCRQMAWRPDIIHCHDWQTAIVPNWLKTLYADDPFFQNTASVYTIHNLGYKGLFGTRVLEIAGLPARDFIAHPNVTPDPAYPVDFMARGIYFADAITTVGERYAREILTPEFGEGLDPVLHSRQEHLFGIPNGIDYTRFDPADDPTIAQTYDAGSLDGRAADKAALQRTMGLAADPDAPLIAMLSRLNDQKGAYLVRDVIERVLALGAQFALMGTGDGDLQAFFTDLQDRYPGQVAYAPTFNEALSIKLFAGSDIYLMPSRFEPCGTNQRIALRFGVVPVVRETGGLADSVSDYDPRTGKGNGFTFREMDAWALYAALVRAIETRKYGSVWRQIQRNGMAADLSWTGPAARYVEVYRWALDKKMSVAQGRQALADAIAWTARVMADLPPRICRLRELAYNLWWTWQPEAQALFAQLDPALWESNTHNPINLLCHVPPGRLAQAAADPAYTGAYDDVMRRFDAYMNERATWFAADYPYATEDTIAYLSFEFGLHESLPIYSGGLGVLAGDTCKEASDLGIPFVAIGFLYPQGFFLQQIDAEGRQIALRQKVNFAELPAVAVRDADGKHVTIAVDLPGRSIYAQLWRIEVGRVSLIMMDTDIERNSSADRELVAQLYHGDHEARLAQEMIFGIGAVRALRAIGMAPSAWHLNEGHGAFLTLELLRELVQGGVEPQAAMERVRAQALFTTHTPVPAGNDSFAPELMDKYFGHLIPQLGLSRDAFLNLGLHDGGFSMTVLALRLTGAANGVSKLHGEVSRQMWGWVWPGTPTEQVPIRAITNGVHTASWLAPEIGSLFARHLGAQWYDQLDDPSLWAAVANIPDEELWAAHNARRVRLVDLVRGMARQRAARLGQSDAGLDQLLDPGILTIGFARRFATYKRATLIFHDPERIKRILNDPARPLQIIFAGKAHPADVPGQEFIRQVFGYSQAEGLRGRIHFLEEYNIFTARFLVAGVDVWLNNPRRPQEASGTSGMKASLNGIPTASILDGWWVEGFNGANGWAIESADARNLPPDAQDAADADALYRVLEQQVVPLYYQRDAAGIPHEWLKVMKEAIRTVAPQFSTRRMLKEYVQMWVAVMARGGAV